jgi:hypothetical protein
MCCISWCFRLLFFAFVAHRNRISISFLGAALWILDYPAVLSDSSFSAILAILWLRGYAALQICIDKFICSTHKDLLHVAKNYWFPIPDVYTFFHRVWGYWIPSHWRAHLVSPQSKHWSHKWSLTNRANNWIQIAKAIACCTSHKFIDSQLRHLIIYSSWHIGLSTWTCY